MSIAVAVKHMLAAGMEPDAIVAAVEEMEAVNMPSPGAIRTRRWREKRASQASQTSQCDAGDKKEIPPKPPKEKIHPPSSPTGSIPPKGPKLCPSDWQPKPETVNALKTEGHDAAAVRQAVREMVDWSQGKGKRMRDWDAALRNWVRRNAKQSNGKPRASPSGFAAALDRMEAGDPIP